MTLRITAKAGVLNMLAHQTEDFCITIGEARLLWGLTKRKVEWAIWRDEIKARQARGGATWLLSYDSCCAAWGKPRDEDMAIAIKVDWNE